MSTVPQIALSRKSATLLHDVRVLWPRRLEDARVLFLLDVAGFMMREIQQKAPQLDIGGKMVDYAKDLRIALLEEGDKKDSIAIYMDGAVAEVTQDRAAKTVLHFRQKGGSPEWVPVLARYGPWPATAVPVLVKEEHAKIIARRARPDEIAALSARQYEQRHEIEMALRSAGATDAAVGVSINGIGVVAHDDLGYNVLRKEFGFDGERQAAHWRPAFKKTKKYAEDAMEKVVKYVKTGDKGVFNLPEHDDSVSAKIMQQGDGFSREIAPFAK